MYVAWSILNKRFIFNFYATLDINLPFTFRKKFVVLTLTTPSSEASSKFCLAGPGTVPKRQIYEMTTRPTPRRLLQVRRRQFPIHRDHHHRQHRQRRRLQRRLRQHRRQMHHQITWRPLFKNTRFEINSSYKINHILGFCILLYVNNINYFTY